MKKNGFTLIELLVAITIVAVMAGLSAIGMQNAFTNARDTRRRSDLKQYQTSLESLASRNNGLYIEQTSIVRASTTLCGNLGLTSCPEDPTYERDTTSGYYYRYISNNGTCSAGGFCAIEYVLWGRLENVSSTTYQIFCSNGKNGTLSTAPSAFTCPLP